MSQIENIISRLQKVKGRNGSWTACCPAHEDRSPSLAIRETPDGRILLHCFGGCSTESVLGAIGMDLTDLFPPTNDYDYTQPRKPLAQRFYASDMLRVIQFEASIVAIAAYDMANGKKLETKDLERLKLASLRINEACEAANV